MVSKPAQTKWLAIAGVVGFVLLLSGMVATAWFLNSTLSTDDPVGPTDSEAAVSNSKSACDGFSISKASVSDLTEQVTLNATGSDADGPLAEIMIYAAVNGQKNGGASDSPCIRGESFYCAATDAWLKVATSPSNSVSLTTTFADLEAQLISHAANTGWAYEGDIKEKGIVLAVNTVGQNSRDLCSSNIAMFDGNGAYYGYGDVHWEETCKGGCVQRLVYVAPPVKPTDLQCNEACADDTECSGSLVCYQGNCRADVDGCRENTDCVCETGEPVFTGRASSVVEGGVCTVVNGVDVARATVTVSARNTGDKEGGLDNMALRLDQKIDPNWVLSGSISDGGSLSLGSTVNGTSGNWIKWDLGGKSFAPGENIAKTFTLDVPQTSGGSFNYNLVLEETGKSEATVQDGTLSINCSLVYQPVGGGGLPTTGIFDSTESKLLAAGFMITLSAVLIGLESTDRGVVRFFTGSGRYVKTVQVKYSKEQRDNRKVGKNRERFEKDWDK